MSNTIEFTREKMQALRKEYNRAVRDGKDVFIFEGHELLVSYAKYVLEYLSTLFPTVNLN